MNQHTKGPWKTQHGQSYTAICAGAKVVGYIDHFNEHDKRLVTSAPDLLDALEDLLECPYHIDEATVSKAGLEATMNANPHQVVGNMSVALLRVRKARAAIAKARGEA